MSMWLDPTGRTTFGIALCARCSKKMFLDQLYPDPNSPGLMVCEEDRDVLDPYRLPPRADDQIVLPFVRPDVSLDTGAAPDTTGTVSTYTLWSADFWSADVWATDFWA
jgi:hypothetical protein